MSGIRAAEAAAGEVEQLLDEIRADARETAVYTGRPVFAARVLDAVRRVPRHCFVPAGLADVAYVNDALAIGCGQTISQPYIVALMTDLAAPGEQDSVLEVGTGSGYQAAVLAQLAGRVHSLEIIETLADVARQRLQRLGCTNVEVRCGNGCFGWPEDAPYDAILVTAAAPGVPPALLEQLKPGGRLVIPLVSRLGGQDLYLITKDKRGLIARQNLLPVRFVPLTGLP